MFITDYFRSVTIVTKKQNDLFTEKIGQFHPKTDQFRHIFEVKNVVNFSNSSRQYSVNGKAKAKPLLYHCWYSTVIQVFGNLAGFLGLFSLKFHQNSSKSYNMTFGMQKSMCEKVANFKCLKVSKLITLKWKHSVNIFN